MRRFRLPSYAAIAMAVFAAVLMLPLGAQAASGAVLHNSGQTSAAARTARTGTQSSATAAAGTGATDASAASGVSAAVLSASTAADVSAASGGLCSVPGIGDIGGLLGFCSLGTSGLAGDLNNICQPALPDPVAANSGIDAMVAPPAAASSGKHPATLYDEYGVAGNYWAATNLQCSDMTSLIGNNVAGMVFDAAKSIDRVTITIYQSAAGDGIVSWLQRVTDKLISSLGTAIYFPYLAVVVILGAIWLAWQGLIRKRGTRTIEGTIWMIVACAAALFLIGRPADVTGLGAGVSNGISQALNVAFAKLPSPGPSSCVPLQKTDPQVPPASYSYTSGSTVVDQNADELWTVLICKPWLVGEFGTSVYSTGTGKPTVVNTYGRSLLWAQALAVNEKPTNSLIQAKQAAYAGIASSIKTSDPSVYPLFQGNQWTTRLEVGFAALFAALVAGVLVLLISVTLILLKLSFLLLLIVGPFFLLIGTHPGFGRVVALRWVEMLIGVLLKQAAVALVLSLLLYCYALIMGTSDAVLPWALKILMIALVTVAAFIYRKPFQHLFSAVGYGVIGSQERAETDLARAGATARANTRAAATVAVPGFAAYRAGRWARRNPGQAAGLAMAAASGGAAAAVATGAQAGEPGTGTESGLAADGTAVPQGAGGSADGTRTALAARARAAGGAAGAAAEPPPLNLPSRAGGPSPAVATQVAGAAAASSAPAGGGTRGTAGGPGGVPAPAPGAWPLGRSATPVSPSVLRQPDIAPPRQSVPAAAASGNGQPAPGPSARPLQPQRGRPPAQGPSAQGPAEQRLSGPGLSGPGPSGPGPGPSGPGPSGQRQAAPRQAAPRQAAPRQAAPRQAAPRQAAPRQAAPRQEPARPAGSPAPSLGSRIRARWSDSATPAREAAPPQSCRASGRQSSGRQSSGRQAAPREPAVSPLAVSPLAVSPLLVSPLRVSRARGRRAAVSGLRKDSRRVAIRLRDGRIQAQLRPLSTRAPDRISRRAARSAARPARPNGRFRSGCGRRAGSSR